MIVRGYSYVARIILPNESIGGKPLFPVVSYSMLIVYVTSNK
jgi:hypothetical protein